MNKKYFILLLLLSELLVACSPINSMEPFDDKQAAIIARSMMPKKNVAQ